MTLEDTISMTISEDAWNSPPRKNDYKAAERSLYDFGIIVAIPQFDTYRALQKWHRQQIDTVLL